MKRNAVVYWLIPAPPERELFRKIIHILSREFRGASFEPHLTLFVTTRDMPSPRKVLEQITARPLRLRSRGVSFADQFTKTLFVRFKSSPVLKKLAVDLGRAINFAARAPTDPHISLLYKKLPRRTKEELASTVKKLPVQTVTFDSIAAVRLTLPVRNEADVRKWKVVAKKSLS
jgi:2'-5' RNA ligase